MLGSIFIKRQNFICKNMCIVLICKSAKSNSSPFGLSKYPRERSDTFIVKKLLRNVVAKWDVWEIVQLVIPSLATLAIH